MDNYILYGISIFLFIVSFSKNRIKTKKALLKAWRSFEGVLPQLLTINLFIGLIISALNPQIISQLIGTESGWIGVVISAIIGSITLIPGFVAFPMAATLLENGAGYMQIGAFISTLMMVGIVTLPVEIKYFGKRLSFLRNGLAFLFSFLVAFVISKVVG